MDSSEKPGQEGVTGHVDEKLTLPRQIVTVVFGAHNEVALEELPAPWA